MSRRVRFLPLLLAPFVLLGLLRPPPSNVSLFDLGNATSVPALRATTAPSTPFPVLMAARRARLSAACRQGAPPLGKIGLVSLHLPELGVGPSAGQPEWLLYCPVYKAASSNWFQRMVVLAGRAGDLRPGVALDQLAWRVTGSYSRPWTRSGIGSL
jgi:hypothetical protein